MAKNIDAIPLERMEDPLSLVMQNLEREGKPGSTPIYLLPEPDDQIIYMAFEPFTLK